MWTRTRWPACSTSVSATGTARPGHSTSQPAPEFGKRRLILLDRPGAPQAVVRVGHIGLERTHPDFANLLVFNQILGGQFTSRLNEKLREEKGFTYGVRSHFDFRRSAGPFTIGASLQSDRLAEALDDLRREVESLLDDRPPTSAELDDARRALIEGQARHYETPSSLVSRFANIMLHDLPPDEPSRLPERLASVTLDTLTTAARRHIHPESLVAVIVADAELVSESLQGLGWAQVEQIDLVREEENGQE